MEILLTRMSNMRRRLETQHLKMTNLFVFYSGTVRGVAVDQVNSVVISGGADCVLKFWDFNNAELISVLKFTSGISFVFSHRTS